MGILRTDKISGLETPTPVTGSVVFDGTGDYVTSSAFHIADSWTMEFWFNTSVNNAAQRPMNFSNNLNASNYAYIELGSSGNIKARVAGAAAFGSIDAPPINQWHHTALSYDGSTAYFLLNGKLIASQSVSYSNHSIQVRFGADESNVSANLYTGYISNARIVSGEALYTTDYTVPIHAFEVTDGTNLLCFNNADSAAASEHGRPGAAPPTLTVTGDAAASTFSPGLTRDFTFGTEFRGVTTFDTQGYFVPPSGTTEQRGRGRGIYAGQYSNTTNTGSGTKSMQFWHIPSGGTGQDFGDLVNANSFGMALSSATRGVIGGGFVSPAYINVIEYVTIAATGNAVDFGDLLASIQGAMPLANSTRGIFGGDNDGLTIDFITIATLGNAQDFGDFSSPASGKRENGASFASPTRGIFAGGKNAPSGFTNAIDYITISSLGDTTNFGDLLQQLDVPTGCSSSTRGVIAGGTTPTYQNTIQYITISTLGNASDFGDLREKQTSQQGMTNSIRGVFDGGYAPNNPTASRKPNIIDFVTIASTGNSVDFGDMGLGQGAATVRNSASDSHGGIS